MTKQNKVPGVEKSDLPGWWGKKSRPSSYHNYIKRRKRRAERRRAKIDPECVPTYGLFRGWEL